jgi:hypothetical protein
MYEMIELLKDILVEFQKDLKIKFVLSDQFEPGKFFKSQNRGRRT